MAPATGAARLLVLGTYAGGGRDQQHPLRPIVQELCRAGRKRWNCAWSCYPARMSTAYVAGRLGGPVSGDSRPSSMNAPRAMRCCLVNIVEHLVGQGLVVRRRGAVDAAGRGRGQGGRSCRKGCGSCSSVAPENLPSRATGARGGQCVGRTICRGGGGGGGPILDGGRRSVV